MTDLEELGAQYREAKAAIPVHRLKQAEAENAYGQLYTALKLQGALDEGHPPELIALKEKVDKAVADVEWCKATMIAAGEAYKGESFDEIMARNKAYRGVSS